MICRIFGSAEKPSHVLGTYVLRIPTRYGVDFRHVLETAKQDLMRSCDPEIKG